MNFTLFAIEYLVCCLGFLVVAKAVCILLDTHDRQKRAALELALLKHQVYVTTGIEQ